jgi:Ribonuclease G/E
MQRDDHVKSAIYADVSRRILPGGPAAAHAAIDMEWHGFLFAHCRNKRFAA